MTKLTLTRTHNWYHSAVGSQGAWIVAGQPFLLQKNSDGWCFAMAVFTSYPSGVPKRRAPNALLTLSLKDRYTLVRYWLEDHDLYTHGFEQNILFSTRARAMDALQMAFDADPPPW